MDERAEKLASARKKLKEFQRAKQESLAKNGLPASGAPQMQPTIGNDGERKMEPQHNVTAANVPLDPISTHLNASGAPAAFGIATSSVFHQVPVYSNASAGIAGGHSNHVDVAQQQPAPTPLQQQPYQQPAQHQAFDQFQPYTQSHAQPAQFVVYPPYNYGAAQPMFDYQSAAQKTAAITAVDNNVDLQRVAQQLHEEKQRNNDLQATVAQQQTVIESLQVNLKQATQRDTKDTIELQQLQTELASQTKTISILVGERAEQQARISQMQQEATATTATIEELQGRLNASRHRVNELERGLSSHESTQKLFDQSRQTLCTELENAQEEIKRLQRSQQDAIDETTNVQHQLAVKAKEMDGLRAELAQKTGEIELLKVRVEQLASGDISPSGDGTGQTSADEKLALEKQITELHNTVSVLSGEGERIEQQYQTYVQHLTKESALLTQRVDELVEGKEKAAKREESLLNHIQDLERQIQKQISTQQKLEQQRTDGSDGTASKAADEVQQTDLLEKLAALEKRNQEYEKLYNESKNELLATQHQINDKENHIAELTSALERLQTQAPDTTNLLATMESDKVAASRAVAQNQQLKLQLDEIQKAFVHLSNDKLELTTQLQSEQHMSREMKTNYGGLQQELASVKEQLHYKDEEMIRLSHSNTELNKQLLQLSMEVDQLRHHDGTSNEGTAMALQHKLQAARQEIRRLKATSQPNHGNGEINAGAENTGEIQQPSDANQTSCSGHDRDNHEHHHNHDHQHDHHNHDHVDHSHEHQHPESAASTTAASDDHCTETNSVSSTINLATNEAMDKLQARFKRTMNEIADLTEEKQRLEHLVLQLQSETETIGEYIALYQTQRRLLKRREVEKDTQLHRIAADREEMRDKLKQLNGLVELMLVQNGVTNASKIMEKLNSIGDANALAGTVINGDRVDEAVAVDEHVAAATNGDAVDAMAMPPASLPNEQHVAEIAAAATTTSGPLSGAKQETAKKIINLLADIRDKNLKQDFTSVPNDIHHCPCCSGKLEVV